METPANICTPTYLATAAAAIVDSAPEVFKLEVLEEDACKDMGMGCFLGVTACSEEPAKFIHLTYTPKGAFPLTPSYNLLPVQRLYKVHGECVAMVLTERPQQ